MKEKMATKKKEETTSKKKTSKKEETPVTTPTNFKVGELVKIKPNAKYYNGVSIPSWVANDKWYITSISNDRVVLGKNKKCDRNIQSPIHSADISSVITDINNKDDIKALQTMLNSKGYKCEVNGNKDDNFVTTMFNALCDLYSI